MAEQKKFLILRKILSALGLPPEAVDELIAWVEALLAGAGRRGTRDGFPYKLREDFLSPAERSFYLVVRGAVASWAVVCPKVNLADLFFATCKEFGERRAYMNKIDRKHVDFLLCDPQTGAPILGIELNDQSHVRADRRERDSFVAGVFQAAGLPLAVIPVRATYSPGYLDSQLRQLAGRSRAIVPTAVDVDETAKAPTPPEPTDESPTCPRCGGVMTLRVAKNGPNAGARFWGCTHFPKCRAVLPCAAAA